MTVSFQDSDLASPLKTTVVGSDTIGGVDYQRVKVVWGTTGTATELTTTAGLPVQVTGQSSSLNVAATLSSGTQVIGSVMPSSQWTVTTVPTSSSLVIGAVSPSSQWTVTTTPSSQATVSAVLTNPLGWLSSSTSTAATPIIGSVSPSSQWTVSVTPTSAISVTPSSQWTVTTTPSSQITVSAVLTSPLGWLSSSTSTASTPIIGSVSPSSQWTVTTTPSSQITVSLSSGTQVIGSVAPSSTWTVSLSSGTQVIGSVAPSSTWTVALSSGTQVIGSVAASSQWTVTAVTTAVQAFAADSGTIMSSGVAKAPAFATITTSSSGITQFIAASASSVIKVLALAYSVNALSVAGSSANISFVSSGSSVAYSGNTYFSTGTQALPVVLPYNPVGWFQSVSGLGMNINLSVAMQVQGCVTYVVV